MENVKLAVNALQSRYDNRVPNGYSRTVNSALGGCMYLSVGLIKELSDCSHSIRDNDIGKGSFKVYFDGEHYFIEKMSHTLTCIKLVEYHALSLRRIPFRKIKAKNIDDLVGKFDKYLSKWIEFIIERKDCNDIYRQAEYNEKYFIFN